MQTSDGVGLGAFSRIFLISLVLAAIPTAPQAATGDAQPSPRLVSWVEQALANSPELQARAASLAAAEARLSGSGLPIYNPELELEYENTDIDLATAELSQPLDWHGKRGARERVAEGGVAVARAEYDAQRERLAGELLDALAGYEGGRAAADLAERQSVLLKRFVDIARKRGRAGDLGEVEVGLAQLAYAEGKMAAARVQADVADAGYTLYRITGSTDTKGVALPRVPAMTLPITGSPQELGGRHPAVRAARARAQTASAAVRQADLDRRADPTFGIKGGREDDENLIGLRLSIPLQFRNDFRADVDAARSESVQATEDGAQVERTTQAQLQAEQLRFEKLAAAWRIWENEGRGSLDARLKLLERLWRAGELATTDYLVQVQQTLDTESAGLALRRDLWQAWIGWLRAAGQVQTWLGLQRQGESQ